MFGNTSIGRVAGSSQSSVVGAGQTYTGVFSQFIPREDTVISVLEEQCTYNGAVRDLSVIGLATTLPNAATIRGQNISARTLVVGEIFVPRFSAFTKITVLSGSVDIYLLLSPQEANKTINDKA